MTFSTVIVSDGLIRTEAGPVPHPSLQPWLPRLCRMRRRWFAAESRTPPGWYAWWCRESPAALMASCVSVDALPFSARQYWIASPCSLQLSRDRVRVMPEVWLDWDERDANWLCETLNPLLGEDGMQLVVVGRALCLCSARRFDVQPPDFAVVAGHTLPDATPAGADGGFWTRLQTEIQMLLHNRQPPHRSGKPPLQALWFWGGAEYAATGRQHPVATANAWLAAVADARDARLCISEAEALPDLLDPQRTGSMHWLLAGDSHAVWLTSAFLPLPPGRAWQAKRVRSQESLREYWL